MIAIDSPRCTGCGNCALVCPHRVLEIAAGRALLAAEERCIECGACQLNCQEAAISVTKGTGCLVAIARETWLRRRLGPAAGGDAAQVRSDCGCG